LKTDTQRVPTTDQHRYAYKTFEDGF